MDFLHVTAARDLYLVECSTYTVSQLNLVTGLLWAREAGQLLCVVALR